MNQIKTKLNEDLLKGLQRSENKKVVLLFSGGVDSTAAGVELKQQGYTVHPLFIDYGQSSYGAEFFCITKLSKILGFKHPKRIQTDLTKQLSKSNLLGGKAVNDNDAWVPGRNTLFMIIAGIYAKQIDADGICIGYMLDDNFVFGDNDYFHHKDVEIILSRTFLQPMEVFFPIMNKTKAELISQLQKMKILDLTVTCWNATVSNNKLVVCHACANCLERDGITDQLSGKNI